MPEISETAMRMGAALESNMGHRADIGVMTGHVAFANEPETDTKVLVAAIDRYYADNSDRATFLVPLSQLKKYYAEELRRSMFTDGVSGVEHQGPCNKCSKGDCFVYQDPQGSFLSKPTAIYPRAAVFPCLCAEGKARWFTANQKRHLPDWDRIVEIHNQGVVFGVDESRIFEKACHQIREEGGKFRAKGKKSGNIGCYIESAVKGA